MEICNTFHTSATNSLFALGISSEQSKGHKDANTSWLPTPIATPDSVATPQRRNKIIYWTLTLLMFVPGTIGASVEAFTNGPASIVKIMTALGFPLYLMKILGVAKIFGGIAILTGKLPRMKEWAYAGFAFDFVGATAAHVSTGDVTYALFPFSFFCDLAHWLHLVAQDGRDAAAV